VFNTPQHMFSSRKILWVSSTAPRSPWAHQWH